MTQFHNIDLTIGSKNDMTEDEIKQELKSLVDLNSDTLEEIVMISKVNEDTGEEI